MDGLGEIQPPFCGAGDGFTGVVYEDELFADGFAGQEVVVFAGEAVRFAGDVAEEGAEVAVEGFGGGGGDPVGGGVGEVEAFVALGLVIGAIAGVLELVPAGGEVDALSVGLGFELPEVTVLPGGDGGEAPGAEGAEVVGKVGGEDGVAFIEGRGADLVGVIPAVPEFAVAELLGFPAEVGFFGFAGVVGGVADELGVPFCEAEFPGDLGTAELALAAVPAAV